MKPILFAFGLILAWGCAAPGDEPVAETEQTAPKEKIVDETYKFPKDGLVESKIVESGLAGKDFMPGGNFAEYEANGEKYQMFFTLRDNGDQALYLFMDYKDTLQDSKFVPHLGGYFGQDEEGSTLVFQKNKYVIGITGLDLEAADQAARVMAAYLN